MALEVAEGAGRVAAAARVAEVAEVRAAEVDVAPVSQHNPPRLSLELQRKNHKQPRRPAEVEEAEAVALAAVTAGRALLQATTRSRCRQPGRMRRQLSGFKTTRAYNCRRLTARSGPMRR